jgi:hypothetical protein
MKRLAIRLAVVLALGLITTAITFGANRADPGRQATAPARARLTGFDRVIFDNALRQLEEGRRIFRFDTFGDEAFWGDQLQLHQAIAGTALGGVGPGPFFGLGLSAQKTADLAEYLKSL